MIVLIGLSSIWLIHFLHVFHITSRVIEVTHLMICAITEKTRLECFGCSVRTSKPTATLHRDRMIWKCKLCSTSNIFVKKTNSSEPTPAQMLALRSTPVFAIQNEHRKSNLNVFCLLCKHNQTLVINLLAQFDPTSGITADNYKRRLMARHPPACKSCLLKSMEVIRVNNRRIASITMNRNSRNAGETPRKNRFVLGYKCLNLISRILQVSICVISISVHFLVLLFPVTYKINLPTDIFLNWGVNYQYLNWTSPLAKVYLSSFIVIPFTYYSNFGNSKAEMTMLHSQLYIFRLFSMYIHMQQVQHPILHLASHAMFLPYSIKLWSVIWTPYFDAFLFWTSAMKDVNGSSPETISMLLSVTNLESNESSWITSWTSIRMVAAVLGVTIIQFLESVSLKASFVVIMIIGFARGSRNGLIAVYMLWMMSCWEDWQAWKLLGWNPPFITAYIFQTVCCVLLLQNCASNW